ncbi:hypothetical protein [Azospirillum sp. sgz302134]
MRASGAGVAAMLAAVAFCAEARADDEHMTLSTEIPVTVEDAAAIEKGNVDVRLRGFYDRVKENGGRNRLTFDPEIEVGVADGLSLKANPSYRVGNADDAQRGDVRLSAEYNILAPKDGRPGFTVEPLVSIPYGSGDTATEAGITARMTQPLGTSSTAPRLHVNLGWRHLFDPTSDQRDNRFLAVAGVNVAVAPTTAIVVDVLREQLQERGKADNFVEAGLRHMVAEKTALGVGVGVGFGPDSPRYRVLFGLQRSF